MPAITGVETIRVALPTRRVHKWAGLTEPIGRPLIVRLTDDQGNVGWGEAPAVKDWGGEYGRYFGETPAIDAVVVHDYLAKAVVGLEVGNLGELHRRMDRMIKGYPYAKAAVDIAAWDLAGRAFGVPVTSLLGGRVRDRITVTHSIGLLSVEEAADEAAIVAEEGIRAIKVKVGVDPERDIEVVRAVRRAAGDTVAICVDANEGWRTPGEAIRVVRALDDVRLAYVEQPVMGIERLAEVARAIDVPVMADESAWTAHDVLQIVERRAAQIVSIYTTKPGGLYRALQVAAVCQAAGIICNVNGSIESGVGNLANVALAAVAEPAVLGCVIPVSRPTELADRRIGGIYYTDDLIREAMQLEDGCIVVPDGPGFGLDVDEAKIDHYRLTD
jgi:muconate cycloisomerase